MLSVAVSVVRRGLAIQRARRLRANAGVAPGIACGRGQRGQATVELVGVLPFVVLAALVAWQLVLAGHTAWLAGHAARVAARADAVGESVEAGARSALPRSHESGLGVRRLPDGGVRVSVPVPLLIPGWRGPVSVTAESSLGRSR